MTKNCCKTCFDNVCSSWDRLVVAKPPVSDYREDKVWQAPLQHVQASWRSTRFLAVYRLCVSVATTTYFVLVFSLNGIDYFNYLTNWGNFLNCLNFNTLMLAHILRGDYRCSYCCQRQETCAAPGWYWKMSTFIYECTVLLICEITLGYWLIVFPCFLFYPDWVNPLPPNEKPETLSGEDPQKDPKLEPTE